MERNGSVIEQLISITGKDKLFKVCKYNAFTRSRYHAMQTEFMEIVTKSTYVD